MKARIAALSFEPTTQIEAAFQMTQTSSANSIDMTEFRTQMPVAHSIAYFDHAAVGPLSAPASRIIQEWCTEATLLGDKVWPKWNRRAIQLKETAARVINAKPAEIALIPNTSAGINLVADGLPWQPGDNIVLPDGEFPSNLFPWKLLESRGVEVRVVPLDERQRIDPTRIAEACDERTRILAASWVGFSSGFRVDVRVLGEIADRHDALFFLDAIQGLGVFPLDVRADGVDFLAADGHKWMLGPEGAGLFFIRHELLEELRPQQIGWRSVKAAFDYSEPKLELVDSAARFEGGSQNLVGIGGLLGSLQLLESVGLGPNESAIAGRVLEVGDLLCERISEIGGQVHSVRDPEASSGIVSFSPPNGSPEQVRHRLMDRGIVLSCRGGHLRCAVHGYNDESDVDRIIDELRCITD